MYNDQPGTRIADPCAFEGEQQAIPDENTFSASDHPAKNSPRAHARAQRMLQGYMYIEAFKEAHVREAIRGLRNVLVSRGVKLVPLNEMVDAISVNTKAKKAMGRPLPLPLFPLDSWLEKCNGCA